MQIFLSYASEDHELADQVHLALAGGGHHVFFDRDSLPPGGDYHTSIREAVNRSDIFVFLISPNSVVAGSYALTELKYARTKWPHPKGRVLPVLLQEVAWDQIPAFLKAVTVLEPEGNIPAETLEAISQLLEQVSEEVVTKRTIKTSNDEIDSYRKIEKAHKITVPVLIAVIGMVGVLGAAVIANWDKLLPSGNEVVIESPNPSSNVALTAKSIFESLRKSVVRVRVNGLDQRGNAWISESSGFFVSKDGKLVTTEYTLSGGFILSAESTSRKSTQLLVAASPEGPWRTAVVLTVNKDLQLALLQLTDQAETLPVSISEATIEPGEDISVVGYPIGSSSTLLRGVVSRVEPTRISVDAAASPGFAGAPVANKSGEVVGIVVGRRLEEPGTQVLPIKLAAAFLKPFM